MPDIAFIIGVLLVVAGLGMIFRAHFGLQLYENARAWSKVPAVIVHSVLREQTDGEGTSHKVEITCAYKIQGIDYATSKHTQGLSVEEPEVAKRTLASKYPKGRAVAVSVCPSNPAVAVLDTGYPEIMGPLRRFGHFCVQAGVASFIFGAVAMRWN